VPNHDEPVVYLRPQTTTATNNDNNDDESNIATTTASCWRLPTIVRDYSMFALTGYNPMGEDRDLDSNQKENRQLKHDLQQLSNPTPAYIWDSFGFAHDWREDGFVVAYNKKDAQAGEAAIIELAKKYQQGAIYGFTHNHDHGNDGDVVSLLRKTIPAAMKDVEADTVVVACDKPTEMKYADVVINSNNNLD